MLASCNYTLKHCLLYDFILTASKLAQQTEIRPLEEARILKFIMLTEFYQMTATDLCTSTSAQETAVQELGRDHMLYQGCKSH